MTAVTTPPTSDETLLRSFVSAGSEKAFATLVEKYLGFVLGIALRKTSDRALAEEIAQNVFTILARKAARLKANPTLAGWLHRVTVIECADAMRREYSYKTRMNAASKQFFSALGGRDVWQNALPLLDEGIGTLARADREIILLRFFERKSFREIGSALGKSDDAAQKQTDRALQKLSTFLKGKGVVVSTAVLASGMATHVAQAAPAALCHSIAHGALAAASDFTAKTLILKSLQAMTYAKSKAAICAASIVTVSALVLSSGNDPASKASISSQLLTTASSSETAETAPALDRMSSSWPGSPSGTASSGAQPDPSTDLASVALEWEQALFAADPLHRTQRISQLLASLSAADAPAVATAFERAKQEGIDFTQEQRLFLRAWGKLDGSAAVAYATSQFGQGSVDAVAAVAGWATSSAQQAQAFINALTEGDAKESLICGLIDGWSTTDFRAAAAYAESRPASELRNRFRELLLQRALRAGGITAARNWVDAIPDDDANRDYKRNTFTDVIRAMLYRDPAAAAAWISQRDGQFVVSGDAVSLTAAKIAESSPTDALQWLSSLRGSDSASVAQGAGAALKSWAERDVAAAGAWLTQNSKHPFYNQMALSYVHTIASIDKPAAVAWADTIPDAAVRAEAQSAFSPKATTQFVIFGGSGSSGDAGGTGEGRLLRVASGSGFMAVETVAPQSPQGN